MQSRDIARFWKEVLQKKQMTKIIMRTFIIAHVKLLLKGDVIIVVNI